ncbi:hypothetical protein OXX59_002520 [Metschnikowia pulcherrima]
MKLENVHSHMNRIDQFIQATKINKFVPVFPHSRPIDTTNEEEAIETEPLTEAVQDSYQNGHAVVQTQPDILTAIEVPDDEPLGHSSYILPPDKCADQIVSDGVPRSTPEDIVERDHDITSTGIAATNLKGRESTQASTSSNIRGCISYPTTKFAPNAREGTATRTSANSDSGSDSSDACPDVVVSTPEADITETDLSATNVEQERMSSPVHKMVADTSHVASLQDTPGSIESDDDHGRNIISAMDVFEDLLIRSDLRVSAESGTNDDDLIPGETVNYASGAHCDSTVSDDPRDRTGPGWDRLVECIRACSY